MSQLKSSNIKRNIAIVGFGLLIVLALLVSLSSQIIRWYVPHYLSDFGVNAEIEQVHINWFDGQFALHGLEAQNLLKQSLSSTEAKKSRLAVNKLGFNWSWQGVWSSQFALSNIQVEGIRLDVTAANNQIAKVGPFELARFKADTPDATTEQAPWSLMVSQIELKDFDVCYYQSPHSSSSPSQTSPPQCIQWQLIQADSQINLSSDTQPSFKGAITVNALVVDELLSLQQGLFEGVSFEHNQLNWSDIQLTAIKATAQATLNLNKLNLADGSLDLAGENPLALNLKSFSLNDAQLNLNPNPNQAASPVSDIAIGTISFNDLSANLNTQQGALNQLKISQFQANTTFKQQSQPLAHIDKIAIDKFAADGQKQSGDLDSLSIDQLKLWSLTTEQRFAQLVDIQQLNLQQASGSLGAQRLIGLQLNTIKLMEDLTKIDGTMLINANSLSLSELQRDNALYIKALLLNGLNASLNYEQQNGLNVTQWLAQNNQATTDEPDKNLLPIKLASISINDSHINISENTTGAVIQHKLSDITLSVNDIQLNTNNPIPMQLNLAATINQSGKLSAKGSISPDSNNVLVDIDGNIKHLNLTEFSAYSAQHTGYRVDQGQLNSDIKVKIDKNLIDTKFDLLLNKFDLSQLQQHEKNQTHQELGIPLATALNLLKDSDNNIELSIPITGDLDNPQFSAADVISTVSFKAIKSAVLLAYSPLGFVTVASGVIDLATAMRFEPLTFKPEQITMTGEQQKRLTQTSKVLKDKPLLSLVLCANATALDVKPITTAQEQAQEHAIVQPPIDTLIALANQRQQAVKQYLVTEHNIAQHRLLLCNVKLDEKPTLPRVEVSL